MEATDIEQIIGEKRLMKPYRFNVRHRAQARFVYSSLRSSTLNRSRSVSRLTTPRSIVWS